MHAEQHSSLRLCCLLILGVCFIVALMPLTARAATITVNTTNTAVNSDDGLCSLSEAIIAANLNTAGNGCPAGSGASDLIVLAGSTYPLTDTFATYLGPVGLPAITTTVVISGNNATILRQSVSAFGLL